MILAGFISMMIITGCKTTPVASLPNACFTPSEDVVAVNDDVIFSNCSSSADSYSWTFGDGETSNDVSPVHNYTANGTYTVELTATNATGIDKTSTTINVGGTGCVKEVVVVSASINTAMTWDSCHIYYCSYFPILYATLTIEPGTIVKFASQKGMGIGAGGKLLVEGTADAPVIFTSAADDSYGGDTNGDGSATSPDKGDWQYITLGNSSNNSIDYCKILYAGYATANYEQAINMGSGGNNSITNSVIAHTFGGLIANFAALNMSWCPISCVSTNNTFFDNGHPVIIGISSNFDNSNSFHNPDDISETNLCNGIFVDCTHSSQALTMNWSNTEVPYVFGGNLGNSWAMTSGRTLVLGNDVALKFQTYNPLPGFAILMPDGDIQLQNHGGSGVEFTAYNDDTSKGDTNGDGPSTSTNGYWGGISTVGITWYTWSNIYFDSH